MPLHRVLIAILLTQKPPLTFRLPTGVHERSGEAVEVTVNGGPDVLVGMATVVVGGGGEGVAAAVLVLVGLVDGGGVIGPSVVAFAAWTLILKQQSSIMSQSKDGEIWMPAH